MMNHFFINPSSIKESTVLFPADVSHQIVRVLRLKVDALVVVLDNLGHQYEVRLTDLDPHQCVGEIINVNKVKTEAKTKLHLLVALTQREKFELILQKCCELGVSEITPILTERSFVVKNTDYAKKKDRWERILKEAAEQSGRGMIPELHEAVSFHQAMLIPVQCKLIAWENEKTTKADDILIDKDYSDIAVLIGPEGGLSEQEIELSQTHSWNPFSLGKRILRMETAAIVACAIILHTVGEI